MEIQRFENNGRFSKAVTYQGVLYLCGQTGSPNGDVQSQAREIFSQIDALLAQYGSSKDRLLTAQVFLSDIRLFQSFNVVWDSWITAGCEPTRTCIEGRIASPEKFVEVTVSAALQ